MIYLIVDKDKQYCKIGHSITPEQRLVDLQIGSPIDLELLHTINGNIQQEKALHKQFKQYHIRGEWFKYHEDIVNLFAKNTVLPINREIAEANITADELNKLSEYITQEYGDWIMEMVGSNETKACKKLNVDWMRLRLMIKILQQTLFLREVGRRVYKVNPDYKKIYKDDDSVLNEWLSEKLAEDYQTVTKGYGYQEPEE